jgi:hypothetical protein
MYNALSHRLAGETLKRFVKYMKQCPTSVSHFTTFERHLHHL